MAVINFYEDLFKEATLTKHYKRSVVLKDVVEGYIESKDDTPEYYEVYNAKTGKTTFKPVTISGFKVVILVNGEEKDLNYKTKYNDVVSVFYIPQGGIDAGDTVGTLNVVSGILLMGAALVIGIATYGTGFAAIGALGASTLLAAGSAEFSWGVAQLEYDPQEMKNISGKESQALLSIKGGSNQSIVGQRYPIILGKHLINPTVVGSPWHETKTKSISDGRDLGQWFHILYCVGYGPQKLTDFKLGENILCYNRYHNGYDQKTVLHGQLSSNPYELVSPHPTQSQISGLYTKQYTENGLEYIPAVTSEWSLMKDYYKKTNGFDGEIEKKYSKNEVKIEILQAGSKVTSPKDKYGTIYPQVVDEESIGNAALLYVTDKALGDNSNMRTVYGTGVELGFRTNSVRFSHECPLKIEVELEMPSGLYGVRQYRSADGNTSETRYYTIPIDVAVQWRFARNNETPSDAENGDGWQTFDYMVTNDNPKISPVPYDQEMINQAVELNKGIKLDQSFVVNDLNSGWKGKNVFRLCTNTDADGNPNGWKKLTSEEITNYLNRGLLATLGTYTYYTHERVFSNNTPYTSVDEVEHTADIYYVVPGHEKEVKVEQETVKDKENYEHIEYVPYKPSFSDWEGDEPKGRTKEDKTDDYGNVIEEGFNVDGRRYVFEKTFTEDECRQMINKKFNQTPEEYKQNALSSIEIRVIRLSPCYLNQPSDDVDKDSVYGEMSYQDMVKWSAIRTFTFDKKKYEKAFDDIEEGLPSGADAKDASYYSEVLAKNFPERPIPEDDLDKFCYVALSMKEDVLNTVGSSFGNFNCIASSFVPKYVEEDDKWYPEGIEEVMSYYHKRKNSKNKWVIDNISKIDYEYYIVSDPDNTWESRKGTNFSEKIRDLIFIGSTIPSNNGQKIVNPMTRFCITDEMEHKYISNNTASVFAYSFLGAHLGEFQKSFDMFDVPMLTEAYKFYRDVTDGTTENYSNSVNTTNTDYLFTLAHIQNCISTGSAANKNKLKKLYDVPINALRAGCYEDNIEDFCLSTSLNFYYKDKVIDVIETYSNDDAGFVHKNSDGKRHFKFTCNGIVSNETKMDILAKTILLTGRSNLTRTDCDKYAPLIGRPNPYPVTVLNQRNCISKSNSRSFEDSPSGFQINFIDETDNYGTNDIYVMADGEDPRSPTKEIESINFQYVTNRWQLYSLARFNLACKIYQRESYQRTVGVLGYTLAVGDTVLIQDDSLLIGTDNGGRIVELLEDDNYIYGFITDDGFEYTGEVDLSTGLSVQGVTIVQPEQFGSSRCITLRLAKPSGIFIPKSAVTNKLAEQITNIKNKTQDDTKYTIMPSIGTTNIVLLDHAIDKKKRGNEESIVDGEYSVFQPKEDNLVAFGKMGTITSKAVIMGITPKDNDQFELSLVPYNEDLYNAGDEIPVFNANITVPNREQNILYDTKVTTSDLLEHIKNNQTWLQTIPSTVTVPPDRPVNIYANATKEGLTLQCDFDSTKWQNTLGAIYWRISKPTIDGNGNAVWTPINNGTITDPDGLEQIYTARTLFDTSEFHFDRERDGYPETHQNLENYNARMEEEYGPAASVSFKIPVECDISNWRIECCLQNAWGLTGYFWRQEISSGVYQEYINPNTERYGTWIPPVVESQYLDPVVQENGIQVNNYSQPLDSNYYYGYPFQTIYEYSRTGSLNNKSPFTRSGSLVENVWKFIRTAEEDPDHVGYYDGYPEKPGTDYAITDPNDELFIDNAKVFAMSKNTLLYGNVRFGPRSNGKALNWDTYLTWIPEVDSNNCKAGANKRYVTFNGEQNPNRKVYGNVQYGISVSRARQEYVDGRMNNGDWKGVSPASDPNNYKFYNLDTSMTDVYTDEDGYKIGDEILDKDDIALRVNRTHIQEFPLLGQNLEMYNLYQYKYKKFNETTMLFDVFKYQVQQGADWVDIDRTEYLEKLADGTENVREVAIYGDFANGNWFRDPLNINEARGMVFFDGFPTTKEDLDQLIEQNGGNYDFDGRDRFDWRQGPFLIQGVYVFRNYHVKRFTDSGSQVFVKAPSTFNDNQEYFAKLNPLMILDDTGCYLDISPVVYNNKGYLCISVNNYADMHANAGTLDYMYEYNGRYYLVKEDENVFQYILVEVTNDVELNRNVIGVMMERSV